MRATRLVAILLTLLAGLWGPLDAAAIAVAQAANNRTTAGSAVTVTISTTAGNCVYLVSGQGFDALQTLTISDSASQTWTQTPGGYTSGDNSSNRGAAFYKANSAALTSVTATWSGGFSGTVDVVVLELSSCATTSPLDADVNKSNAGPTSPESTNALTTTNANDILIACFRSGGNKTWTQQSPYTIPTNGSTVRVGCETNVVSATQSGVTASMGFSPAGNSMFSIFAAFKDGGGGPSCLTTRLLRGVGC